MQIVLVYFSKTNYPSLKKVQFSASYPSPKVTSLKEDFNISPVLLIWLLSFFVFLMRGKPLLTSEMDLLQPDDLRKKMEPTMGDV